MLFTKFKIIKFTNNITKITKYWLIINKKHFLIESFFLEKFTALITKIYSFK